MGRLQASSNDLGVDALDTAVENDDGTVLFFPQSGVEAVVAARGLQQSSGEFPTSTTALEHRLEGDPVLSVTARYEKSGLLRTREVETQHTYDLTHLAEAVAHLDSPHDPLREAKFWIPTEDPFPAVVELPASPPELVTLQERGTVEDGAGFADEAARRPCGCAVVPRIEL